MDADEDDEEFVAAQETCPQCHGSGMIPHTYNYCACTGRTGPRWTGL